MAMAGKLNPDGNELSTPGVDTQENSEIPTPSALTSR